tara:strand:- start:424 stop:687 length:264 start_codon:yes stop_codon:yes gene_type:complete
MAGISEDDEDDPLSILMDALFGTSDDSDETSSTEPSDPIATLFQSFDQDGDGLLSEDETVAGFQSLRTATMDYLISLQDAGSSSPPT